MITSDAAETAMTKISSTEFQQDVRRYEDAALTEPVMITRDGRDRLVLLSAEEYARLKRRDRRVVVTGELTEAELELIAKAGVPAEYAYLDEELKDCKP
jgi:PHD/YefM family antitoxin component YafN of YafNO toxin-antitoxin module